MAINKNDTLHAGVNGVKNSYYVKEKAHFLTAFFNYAIMPKLFWEIQLQGGEKLNQRHPLRLNVGFLLHANVGFSRDFDFETAAIQVGDDLHVESLRGTVNFARTNQGLYAQGLLYSEVNQDCARCLSEFVQELAFEIVDLFIYPPNGAEDPLLAVPETGILDLAPYLREQILLGAPLRSLCRKDCRGLCPECGLSRNDENCDHSDADIDPRLSALKSLLPD